MIDSINIIVDFSFNLYYPTFEFWKLWFFAGVLTIPISVYRTLQCDKESMIPSWRVKWDLILNSLILLVFPVITPLVVIAIGQSNWQLNVKGWEYNPRKD